MSINILRELIATTKARLDALAIELSHAHATERAAAAQMMGAGDAKSWAIAQGNCNALRKVERVIHNQLARFRDELRIALAQRDANRANQPKQEAG